MKKINYKVAYYTLVILGTVMSLLNYLMYGRDMADWLAVIAITSAVILFIKAKSERKKTYVIMATVMILVAALFVLKYMTSNM